MASASRASHNTDHALNDTSSSVPHRRGSSASGEDVVVGLKRKRKDAPQTPGTEHRQPYWPARDHRQKVSRACDTCKIRRTKCSGTQPCERCCRLSLPCHYTAAYTRGRPPTPLAYSSPGDLPYPGQRSQSSQQTPRDYGPRSATPVAVPVRTEEPLQDHNLAALGPQPPERSRSPHSRASPELAGGVAHEGPYLGPASGIAFLNRIWQRLVRDRGQGSLERSLKKASQASSVFAFGDKTFAHYTDDMLVLPSKQEALTMVSKYFDLASPVYRFLHRGTVDSWLVEIYRRDGSTQNMLARLPTATVAVVLMIFAETVLFQADVEGIPDAAKPAEYKRSDLYFSAARHRLSMEIGYISLESVQARLMQCLYLLASSRANQAWYHFGSTVQLVFAQGMHRRRMYRGLIDEGAFIINECRKRTFWASYTLDRYLSVLLGRPRIFQDEDIDQEYPTRTNDEDMTRMGTRQLFPDQEDCLQDAPIWLAKLARIIAEISREAYSIRPVSGASRLSIAAKYLAAIHRWRTSLPPVLGTVSASSLIPTFRHQNMTLRLAHAHAILHTTRPLLLQAFTELGQQPTAAENDRHGGRSLCEVCAAPYIIECVKAARTVTETIQGFVNHGLLFHAAWFPQYIGFCAVVVLYVYSTLVFHHGSFGQGEQSLSPAPTDVHHGSRAVQELEDEGGESGSPGSLAVPPGEHRCQRHRHQQDLSLSSSSRVLANPVQEGYERRQNDSDEYYSIAEICQTQLALATPPNSFSGRRCNIILEELRLEVCRQTRRPTHPSPAAMVVNEPMEQTFIDSHSSYPPGQQGVAAANDDAFSPVQHQHGSTDAAGTAAAPSLQDDLLMLESLPPWADLSDLDSWAYANPVNNAGFAIW